MSSRAIRRLREEKYFGTINNDNNDDDNDNYNDDDDDDFDELGLMLPQTKKKKKKKKKKNMKKVIEYMDESDSDNLSDGGGDNYNDKEKDEDNDDGAIVEADHKDCDDVVDGDEDLSLSSEASEASSLYEPTQKKQSTFSSLLMMDDSDSDEDEDEDEDKDSSDSDSEDGGELNKQDEDGGSENNRNEQSKTSPIDHEKEENPTGNTTKSEIDDDGDEDNDDDDDNFDAILSEFHESDKKQQELSKDDNGNAIGGNNKSTTQNIFLNDIDPRDFDLEHSLRSMLGGGVGAANINVNNVVRVAQGGGHNNMGGGGGRGNRRNVTLQKRCLFAQGREEWGRRPSSYIGGGLGMEEIEFRVPSDSINSEEKDDDDDDDDEKKSDMKEGEEEGDDINTDEETNVKNYAPWPYSDPTVLPTSQQYANSSSSWHKFQRSNTYTTKLEEFRSYVSTTGDINMLAMFVADNPFIIEPLLQLAMFFFHTRENEKGLDLVKRILWIFECACTSGFLPSPTTSRQSNNNANCGKKTKFMFMDQSLDANEMFFSTLNLFVKNSTMVGCVNTSLAGSRLLLSLDPLRDPMGVLLTMDYFSLATMKEVDYQFVINLIESEMISIYHRRLNDIGEYEPHRCKLINMPNWRYSYALALYKLSFLVADEDDEDELMKVKATEALKSAIRSYPFIPKLLLDKNKINTTGRSFQIDWPSVLSPLREFNEDLKNHEAVIAGLLANDYEVSKQKITQIFIDRSHKLWCGDDVVKWLYDCCVEVVSVDAQTNCEATTCVPLALLRYSSYDPADFEDSFAHIPVANALDPQLVDLALHVRQNARRLLRMPQQQGGMPGGFNIEGPQAIQQIRALLGTGRDGMEVIDPDLPFAEIFWRSLMPWARVDGVPPGNNNNN